MVTEFEVVDGIGNVIGYGEIESKSGEVGGDGSPPTDTGSRAEASTASPDSAGEMYRLFSNKHSSECQEFDNLKDMLTACGGAGIQPSLFETLPRDRQLNLLGGKK